MKAVLLVIISSLFISASTELHQFLKIPFLLEHYYHHHEENPSLSFFDFLKLHYADEHPADRDDQEDNKLPFKSPNGINHTDVSITFRDEAAPKPYISLIQFRPAVSENVPSSRSNSIFQPPELMTIIIE